MWIKQANVTDATTKNKPRFVKKFALAQDKANVVKAELEISALGIFSLQVNGRTVPDYFMPGCTNYNKFVYLCRYDLTQDMQKDNVLAITLADGWYSGRLGYHRSKVFGTELCAYAKLTIRYQDGTMQTLSTDESWKVQESEILHADFFDGQTIDERLRRDVSAVYDSLENAVPANENRTFKPYPMERVACIDVLLPQITKKDGKLILDFKQNFAGVVSFTARGKSGQTIVVRHAEMLDANGDLYVENLRKAVCTDTLILSDETAYFAPEFTFHGFQYAEISLLDGDVDDVTITDIKGLVFSQELRRTGDFACSNPLINKIYQNIYWGQLGNFLAIPTDCPQRDERLGWAGDAQVFCDTAMYNADCNLFYKHYLDILRVESKENGSVANFAPFACTADNTDGVPCWGDAIAIMPYMHYLAYGDISIIQDNLPAAKAWIDFYRLHLSDGLAKNMFTFGDWLSVGEETNKDALIQCYYGYSLSLTAKMCALVGEDNTQYLAWYEQAKEAFRKAYIAQDGTVLGDTQTIYAVAYAIGFMSADEIKKPFVSTVHRRGDTLTTGFVGVKFLLPVLCDIGETELAYKLIAQTKFPSWGYCIAHGATTIWERWNGYTEEDGFFNPSMNSFNHYSLGSCGYWLYAYVLGIRLNEKSGTDGEMLIKPVFSPSLAWAKGSYQAQKGKISVAWSYEEDGIHFTVEADKALKLSYDFGAHTVLSRKQNEKTTEFVLSK